jgi:thioredoxin
LNEHVRELTSANWEAEVLKAGEPVLVDFWAAWCAPCRAIAPTIDALAQQYAGKVKVGKLNVDEHGEIAEKYGIRSIPTLLVFRSGEVADQRVGALPRPQLEQLLEQHAASTASR